MTGHRYGKSQNGNRMAKDDVQDKWVNSIKGRDSGNEVTKQRNDETIIKLIELDLGSLVTQREVG